jgi:predicted ribosomally synthesized peptide with nif11-like leader
MTIFPQRWPFILNEAGPFLATLHSCWNSCRANTNLAAHMLYVQITINNRRVNEMSVEQIAAFSRKAQSDTALAEQLKSCEKMKELFALARENGFSFNEDSLYPPNEPQFSEEQLSQRLAKALLRA